MSLMMESVHKPLENCLDPQLWYACAGGMAQVPPPNSRVFYFPQGHAEHANGNVDFGGFGRIPPMIPCAVQSVKYLADSETDEVFARIRLVPVAGHSEFFEDDKDDCGFGKIAGDGRTGSFAKTLTQSDANNGGGFSVPRFCAETIFPRLDYAAEPPVQTVVARDVHGEAWRFRHIYRGTPRRHLLTTGWSSFVNRKRLVAGDSIVFLRAEDGDLRVGIRRAKPGGIGGGGTEVSAGWKGLPEFLNRNGRRGGPSVTAEAVAEAAALAAGGQEFDVVYYPRASAPEFVVRAAAVAEAVRVRWCAGMRFKMAFETEDSSRISWFMGTVSAACVEDPGRWPNSPWRMLQVVWDEPELLQNLRRVNPWLVELAAVHLSPPRKRPRPLEFFGAGQSSHFLTSNPLSPSSPLCHLPDNMTTAAGVQGARHVRFELPSSSNLQLQAGLKPFDFKLLPKIHPSGEGVSPMFVLFGQPILTAEQMSQSQSSSSSSSSSSEAGVEEDGQCKVFVESKDVGRIFDISILGSYDQLFHKLSAMSGMQKLRAVYRDAKGATMRTDEEPYRDFAKNVRRITILAD